MCLDEDDQISFISLENQNAKINGDSILMEQFHNGKSDLVLIINDHKQSFPRPNVPPLPEIQSARGLKSTASNKLKKEKT